MAPKISSPYYFVGGGLLAAYCIIYLHVKNGFFSMLGSLGTAHPTRLPWPAAADGQLREVHTGIKPLDTHIAGHLRFFWPTVSGELPQTSLFTFWAAGQVLSGHTLLMLEGLRAGNKGRLIAYTSVVGMIYQTIPFGIIMPFWAALYLWTSPIARMTAAATPPMEIKAALAISDADIAVLPHSLILGYILPTTLAALPRPIFNNVERQQVFLLIWQAFPIYVSLAQFVLSKAAKAAGAGKQKGAAGITTTKSRLRWVYVFVLGVTALTHVTTLALLVFPGLQPAFMQPAAGQGTLDAVSLFKPTHPLVIEQVPSIAHGVLSLLQYDMYFGTGAVLLLAANFYWAATGGAPSMMSVLTLLSGPAGAALALLWRRDELILFRQARLVTKKKE